MHKEPGTLAAKLAVWNTLYAQGKFASVITAFESAGGIDADPDVAPELRQIAAQCYVRCGKWTEGVSQFVIASASYAARRSVQAGVCLANACQLLRQQQCSDAADWFALAALTLPTECDAQVPLLRDVFASFHSRGDEGMTACVLAAASMYASTRTLALSTLLEMVRQGTQSPAASDFAATVISPCQALTSIIVCSNDDARFARFSDECARAFAGDAYEIVRVHDAASMCEGYNRGMATARGDMAIFCHDDVEFLFTHGGTRLKLALSNADVLCCVGASKLTGPIWLDAGPPHLQGWMAMPEHDGRYVVSIAGVPDPERALVTADGCFIACHTTVAIDLGWDAINFTRFHMYDADFCARAKEAGYRVRFATRMPISHLSGGSYGAEWRTEADKFVSKHRLATPPDHANNPWICVHVDGRDWAERSLRRLADLVPPDWRTALRTGRERIAKSAAEQCHAVAHFERFLGDAAVKIS